MTKLIATVFTLTLFFISCDFNLFNPSDNPNNNNLDAQGYTLEGQKLLREGNFEEASIAFENAISLDSSAGYPRYGYVEAEFDRYNFSQVKVLEMFYSDSSAQNGTEFDKLVELFMPDKWSYEKIDSLYAPIHTAVMYLVPMFSDTFQSSDEFNPDWIAPDFSILLAFHAFIGILDYDGNGRINEDDNIFKDISIKFTDGKLSIDGLNEILSDPNLKNKWQDVAQRSIGEVIMAYDIFVETFGDSTNALNDVDSLLVDFSDVLQDQIGN